MLAPRATHPEPERAGTVKNRLLEVLESPSRSGGRIQIALGVPATVALQIFDVAGRCVRHLGVGTLPPGIHRRDWDGFDDRGQRVASGMYLITLTTSDLTLRQKFLVLRRCGACWSVATTLY